MDVFNPLLELLQFLFRLFLLLAALGGGGWRRAVRA
jgi:hypothetical protein